MGISGVGAVGSVSSRQMTTVQPADSVSKNIQNEISSAQRQKQQLTSKGDMSAKEKMKKSQELQQEISSLNTQLRMREEDVQKEQKKEALSGEVRPVEEEKKAEDKDISIKEITNPDNSDRKLENLEIQFGNTDKEETEDKKVTEDTKETKDTDTGASAKETKAVSMGDTAIEQAQQKRKVIVRMKDAIAILKGEIKQDEARGIDVENKKAELDKQEDKLQKASGSQFSVLGDANKAMREARQAKMNEVPGQNKATSNAGRGVQDIIKATNFAKENNAAMQFFIN